MAHTPEFNLFLSHYRLLPKHQFALVRVSHSALQEDGSSLAESVAMMQQLGMIPSIVLDTKWDSFLDTEQPIASDRESARRFGAIADFFMEQIRFYGGEAELVKPAIDVRSIPSLWEMDPSAILDCFNRHVIPIILPFGHKNRRRVYINGQESTRLIMETLSPNKYILITEQDGLRDHDDSVIPFLNLSEQRNYRHILSQYKPLIREIRLQLNRTPDAAAVITNAHNLLREIFTVKGQGTFIKRFTIHATSKIRDLDIPRLKQLIEDAFDKDLVEDYFNEKFKLIVYEKNYEGVAIVKLIHGIPYLDKIAVTKAAEGTGLGGTLWAKIVEQYPTLVWRSTTSNPMNSFYFRQCHGCIKGSKWIVYWRNLNESLILEVVHRINAIRSTLR